jgi:hypothetical protein
MRLTTRARREHLPVPVDLGGVAATSKYLLAFVDHLDRGRPLMRIHPDHYTAHRALSPHLVHSGRSPWRATLR